MVDDFEKRVAAEFNPDYENNKTKKQLGMVEKYYIEALDELAKKRGLTRTNMVRVLIKAAIGSERLEEIKSGVLY